MCFEFEFHRMLYLPQTIFRYDQILPLPRKNYTLISQNTEFGTKSYTPKSPNVIPTKKSGSAN